MTEVTTDQLKQCHWEVVFFMDGDDPKHTQAYKCREHPRLTKTNVKPRKEDWRTVYAVDGIEIERGTDTAAWLQQLVDALNKPEGQP